MMQRPNILIVMTDHQRCDTVLPDSPCIAPNVKAMAKEGLTLTNMFSPMAHCCPARASFWSGLYPSRHGVWNNVDNAYAIRRGPYESVRMFSQDLADAGYDLAYCGKWHVSAHAHQQPKDYGWRELRPYGPGFQDEGAKWEGIRESAGQPDADGEDTIMMPGYDSHRLYGTAEGAPASDEQTTELAMAELSRLTGANKPWCLYVGWNAPHAPYVVDKEYVDLYELDDIPLPPSYADEMHDKPDYYRKVRERVFNQLGEKGTREAIRHFWAMCTKIDVHFGRLLERLDASGQKDNTIVIFCSDHGDYAGDHGLFHKQVPAFLGAYKVPTVIRWPRGIRNPGRTVDDLFNLADFAPTLLEAAGIKSDRYFTGRSFVPFLEDHRPADWREEVCTQCEGTEHMFTQRMVVTGKHKYVYNGFGRDELYDLEADPHEMINLESDARYDGIKRDLVGRMWRFAYREQDRLGSTQYIMVNTAPFGPKEAFRGEKGTAVPPAHPNPDISR